MDIISLAIGIALGAAFSPFWMKLWGVIKAKITTITTTPTDSK